jgi:dephospho-CoA kinase
MNVIGLVGPFGSGCTYVAKILEEKHSYKYISLSDILRDKYLEIYPELDDNRSSLQDFGDEYRKQNGSNILAKLAIERMDDTNANYVVDSIRNPEEIKELRNSFANFYLIGVFADNDIRYERVKRKYNDDRRLFDKDDKRDSGEKSSFGQQVTNSFRQADLVILNNDIIRNHNDAYNNLIAKIKENIDIIDRIIPFRPNPHETYMAMAYAVSMRSS